MADINSGSASSLAQMLSLPEIIFSCGVCQATVSEIYATPESNKGFRSGWGDDNGIVTKLWIAECSHVSCGKHLAGGAAPFHPHDEQPKALCPQCAQNGDQSPKKLYGIRGLDSGEHDHAIPQSWFQCPPMRLSGSTPGMDAMRFQFMALARHAQMVHSHWKAAEAESENTTQQFNQKRRQIQQLQDDLSAARLQAIDDAAALAKTQQALEKWKTRAPVINELVASIKPMADELRVMRSTLNQLGFDVPKPAYGLSSVPRGDEAAGGTAPKEFSINDVMPCLEVDGCSTLKKRKRVDSETQLDASHTKSARTVQRISSRDMMPPPVRTQKRDDMQDRVVDPPVFQDTRHEGLHESHATLPIPQQTLQGKQRFGPTVSDQIHNLASSPPQHQRYVPTSYPRHLAPHILGNLSLHDQRNAIDHADQSAKSTVPASNGLANNQIFPVSQYMPPQRVHLSQRAPFRHDMASQQHIQHREMAMRQPSALFRTDHTGLQTPSRSSNTRTRPNAISSPFKINQPTAGSVSSPFFQQETNILHPASRLGPPSQRRDDSKTWEHYNNVPIRLRNDPSGSTWLQHSCSRPSMHGSVQDNVRLQPGFGYHGNVQIPTSAFTPYWEPTMITQDYGESRSGDDGLAYGFAPPQDPSKTKRPSAPRDRITLSQARPGVRRSDLLNIQGLRGGRSRDALGPSSNYSPSHHESRPLFSAIGRRSAQR